MDNRAEKAKRKNDMNRVRTDSARDMRAVKHFDHPYVLDGCPIQPIESYILADRDNWGSYAELSFKSLSEKPLKRLKIRLDFYYYQNIPYNSLFFEYCRRDLTFGKIYIGTEPIKDRTALKRELIYCNESFGEGAYIPLPESSYTDIVFYIEEAEFENGEVEYYGKKLNNRGRRLSELDEVERRILLREKRFARYEAVFPSKNLPMFSDSGWVCCCGHKNTNEVEQCKRCMRPRELQKELISESAIAARKKEYASQPSAVLYHDKSRFPQNKYLQNKADLERREEEIKRSKANLEEQARQRRRKESHWLFRGFATYIIFLSLSVIIAVFLLFADISRDGDSFIKMLHRIFEGDSSVFEFFGFEGEEEEPTHKVQKMHYD